MRKRWSRQDAFDGAAIGLSALCLVHCLALPVLFLLVPTLTVWLALPESTHVAVLVATVPISAVALAGGFARHRRLLPAAIALVGIAALVYGVAGAIDRQAEVVATVIGGSLLAAAHAGNWRLARRLARSVPTRAAPPADRRAGA